jgi:hypothetical protein
VLPKKVLSLHPIFEISRAMNKPIKIFSGRQTRYLAENIAKSYGQKLGEVQVTVFSDGEFTTSFEENLRAAMFFIVQSTFRRPRICSNCLCWSMQQKGLLQGISLQ